MTRSLEFFKRATPRPLPNKTLQDGNPFQAPCRSWEELVYGPDLTCSMIASCRPRQDFWGHIHGRAEARPVPYERYALGRQRPGNGYSSQSPPDVLSANRQAAVSLRSSSIPRSPSSAVLRRFNCRRGHQSRRSGAVFREEGDSMPLAVKNTTRFCRKSASRHNEAVEPNAWLHRLTGSDARSTGRASRGRRRCGAR